MRAQHSSGSAKKTSSLGENPVTVGWMGLTLHAPEGWSPVSVSGEGTQGYLKVVSPDTRHLEIKWEEPKGIVNVPTSLEGYFRKLRQAARKSRQEIVLKERPRGMSGIRPQNQAPIPYSWTADRKGLGCIWHCGACNRMVIAELVGDLDDDLSLAADLLRGVHDHAEKDAEGVAWNTWALYGLRVEAPAGYSMQRHVLQTGFQRFLLKDGTSTVQADRWGLAEIALRGTNLRTWYESREAAFLGRYAYRVEETEINGHPAYRFRGRLRAHMALLRLATASTTLAWPRFFLHGYLWQCPETNRIYALMGEQTRHSTVLEQVMGRLKCH